MESGVERKQESRLMECFSYTSQWDFLELLSHLSFSRGLSQELLVLHVLGAPGTGTLLLREMPSVGLCPAAGSGEF